MILLVSPFYGGREQMLNNIKHPFVSLLPKYPFEYMRPFNNYYECDKNSSFYDVGKYFITDLKNEYHEVCVSLKDIFKDGLWQYNSFDLAYYISLNKYLDKFTDNTYVIPIDTKGLLEYITTHHTIKIEKIFIFKADIFRLYSMYKELKNDFNKYFESKTLSYPIERFVANYKNMIFINLDRLSDFYLRYLNDVNILLSSDSLSDNINIIDTTVESSCCLGDIYLGSYDSNIVNDETLKANFSRLKDISDELFETKHSSALNDTLLKEAEAFLANRTFYCPRIDNEVNIKICEDCISTEGASLQSLCRRTPAEASKYPCIYQVIIKKECNAAESVAKFNWLYLP